MKWGDALNSTHIYFTIQGMKRRSMGPSHYLNCFLFAPSCERGRWEGTPLADWKGKGTGQAGPGVSSVAFPRRTDRIATLQVLCKPDRPRFKAVFSHVPWESGGMHPGSELSRSNLTIPSGAQLLINQDSNGWLIFREVHEMTETKLPTALYFSNHLNLRKLEFLYPRSPPLKQWGHLLGSNSGT